MINDKAYEVLETLFESLPYRDGIGLEISMNGSDFIFDCAQFLFYKCQQLILNDVDHI